MSPIDDWPSHRMSTEWSTLDGQVRFYPEEHGWSCCISHPGALTTLGAGQPFGFPLDEGASRASVLAQLDEVLGCGTRLRRSGTAYLFVLDDAAVAIRREGRTWYLHDIFCSSSSGLDDGARAARSQELSVLRTGPFGARRFPTRNALVVAVEAAMAELAHDG